MNERSIKEIILRVYKECGITTFPVDCFCILENYKYRLYTYSEIRDQNEKLYEICLNYSHDAFRDGLSRIIAYNERMSPLRVRFSLMHELGHILLRHKGENPLLEDEANYFASNLLAPRAVIRHHDLKTADQIHDLFALSYQASNLALIDYKRFPDTKCPVDQQIHDWFFPPAAASCPAPGPRRKPNLKKYKNSPDAAAPDDRISYLESCMPDLFYRRAESFYLFDSGL